MKAWVTAIQEDGFVGARDSIAEALGKQMPVWKIKQTAARKATEAVRARVDYMFTKMEIAQ